MKIPLFRGIGSKLQKVPLIYFMSIPILIFLLWYVFSLDQNRLKLSYSTILEDRNGELLGARLSRDHQWRFPPADTIPAKYLNCLLSFEDKRFYKHPGVDPIAMGRAVWQNFKSGKRISGGSTITMQVVRMSQQGKKRTVSQKIIEIILATRLELSFSKEEILKFYTADAPFGGNVRGIDAAAWRYFGRRTFDLTWAESALLAVLPNSPSLIHPGRNRILLLEKRNRLLLRLMKEGKLDSLSGRLAISEPLPAKPQKLPNLAPHVLEMMAFNHPGERLKSSIDKRLQERAVELVKGFQKNYSGNGIYNAAALIVDAESGNVMAYIGNSVLLDSANHAEQVDLIKSFRSTGSLLKPILYASMLDEGDLLPGTLVPDIPTNIAGYSPKNYEQKYDGAVPARRAIARSLNVPAVKLLQQYGYEKFHLQLKKLGIHSLNFPPDHYGLTLILGGAEASLWDLTGMYSSLTRVLLHYIPYNGGYDKGDYRPLNLLADSSYVRKSNLSKPTDPGVLRASAIWLTYQAMVEVNRPDADAFWQNFSSRQPVAWKTGTSFGNRDGWAIGTTSKYLIGVWVGNADGEGRPLLTGIGCAAPIMFGLFDLLPASKWFEQPFDEMVKIPVCRQSGHRVSLLCPESDSVWVCESGLRSSACPYHLQVHLDQNGKYRVSSACADPGNMVHKSWFVLPPSMEWYYKSHDQGYKPIPPLKKGCTSELLIPSMELLYPRLGSRVYVPTELSGKKGRVICEAIHRDPGAIIYWHLDNEYLGQTSQFHQLSLHPKKGHHRLTLVDQNGESLVSGFEVLEK
jgi:penicillin-binding protein 1C